MRNALIAPKPSRWPLARLDRKLKYEAATSQPVRATRGSQFSDMLRMWEANRLKDLHLTSKKPPTDRCLSIAGASPCGADIEIAGVQRPS